MALTTAEQAAAVAEYQKFVGMLKPAVLAETQANGSTIYFELEKQGLPLTAASMLQVVDSILFTNQLTWKVQPKKLQARKVNEAKQNASTVATETATFEARRKAADVVDKAEKDNAKLVDATYSLIDSYYPVDAQGRVAHAQQQRVQESLKDYVTREVLANHSRKDIYEKVRAYIEKQYADAERANERV